MDLTTTLTGFVALYINFDTGQAELKKDGVAAVKEIATLLKTNPTLKLRVEGHADNTGPEAHNQWLAKARAEEVASLLRRKGADKKYKINVSGHSSSKPLADNGTEDGRAKNRRVEVSYAGGN